MDGIASDGPLHRVVAAIEDRLALVFPERAFGKLQVLPAQLSKEVWDKLAQRLPAVALQFVRLSPATDSGRIARCTAAFNLYLVTQNAAGPRAQLLGDSKGIGIAGMATVAMLALHGLRIEGVGSLACGDADTLGSEWLSAAMACAGMPLTIGPFLLLDAQRAGDLDDFLRHGVTWDLPGDDEAVSDLITVRPE